ncbi:MAG: hypothetical protein Q4E99_05950, partial [Bacillota bacterium]|nr:hypothetical protein [Bacillota bacterium]
GPYCYDCPKAILKLLTPTDSEWANEWRRKCFEKHNKPKLSDLPIGTKIKFERNGKEIKLFKHAPGYQFKRPFWMAEDGCSYMQTKHIPENWEVC